MEINVFKQNNNKNFHFFSLDEFIIGNIIEAFLKISWGGMLELQNLEIRNVYVT